MPSIIQLAAREAQLATRALKLATRALKLAARALKLMTREVLFKNPKPKQYVPLTKVGVTGMFGSKKAVKWLRTVRT